MQPIDFRTATFDLLRERIAGVRWAVLSAWRQHGPCTTQQLAERSEISILSLRPRTTELFQLGFICLAEKQPEKSQGVYRVRTDAEIAVWFIDQRDAATPGQKEFKL